MRAAGDTDTAAGAADQLEELASDRRRGRRHALLAIGPAPERFPAGLARTLVERFTRPGDTTLDPFCAHPGALAQAAWNDRLALAVAPDAAALGAARSILAPPDPKEVVKRLRELQNDMFYGDPSGAPAALRERFDRATLSQLVHLREQLDPARAVDGFVVAFICGWLADEANHSGGPVAADRSQPRRQAGAAREAPRRGRKRDLFDILQRRIATVFHRPPPHAARDGGLVLPAQHGRIGRDTRAMLSERAPALAFGAPPPFTDRRVSGTDTAWRWFARMGPDAAAQIETPCLTDVPGYLEYLSSECATILRTLASGGVCALLVRDARLDGRPARVVPLAERLWRRMQEAAAPCELVGVLALKGPRAPSLSERSRAVARDRLLLFRKPRTASELAVPLP